MLLGVVSPYPLLTPLVTLPFQPEEMYGELSFSSFLSLFVSSSPMRLSFYLSLSLSLFLLFLLLSFFLSFFIFFFLSFFLAL